MTKEERKINLQLFAEDDDEGGDEGDDSDEFDEYKDDEGEGEEEQDDTSSYRSQADVDKAIENRLARERKKLAKMFGVGKLEEAAPYLHAGRAVSQAAGLKPHEVVSRLGQQPQQQQQRPYQQGYAQGQQPPAVGDTAVLDRMSKIETLLESEREEKVRTQQEVEAKKEFGKLYDSNRDEIEDKAEELGLSLIDAATIVLRPKLKEHLETRQREKQTIKGKRRVESSSEGPPSGDDDISGKLTAEQKRVAQKSNLSYKDYYEQLKSLGRVE